MPHVYTSPLTGKKYASAKVMAIAEMDHEAFAAEYYPVAPEQLEDTERALRSHIAENVSRRQQRMDETLASINPPVVVSDELEADIAERLAEIRAIFEKKLDETPSDRDDINERTRELGRLNDEEKSNPEQTSINFDPSPLEIRQWAVEQARRLATDHTTTGELLASATAIEAHVTGPDKGQA